MPSIALLILCGFVSAAIGTGVRQSFGLFLPPVTAAHGWTVAAYSLALSVQVLLMGAAQPFAGRIADQYGSRRVLWFGAGIYIAGLVVMASAQSYPLFFGAAGIALGIATSSSGFPIIMAALTRLLPDQQRSRAMGLITAGGSFGQFAVVPLSQLMIDLFGWQGALFGMAGLVAMIVPLTLPYGAEKPAPIHARGGMEQTSRAALAEAFGARSYWCLIGGFFVCGVHVAFLTLHMPAFVASCGLHPSYGSASISMIGLFNIMGSMASGELSTRMRRKYILAFIYTARAVAMLLFLLGPKTPTTVLLFSAAMGLLWLSTVPPTAGLVGQIWGTRWMGTLFGVVYFSHQVGGFLGGYLGGLIWERTGSYDGMWWIAIACGFLAGIVNLPIIDRGPSAQPAKA
ncbi:MAG: MFS transporter [Alphaproteobacteria bacterium]|nr:MFS transporter [Alphaproteobacteria bacterium]